MARLFISGFEINDGAQDYAKFYEWDYYGSDTPKVRLSADSNTHRSSGYSAHFYVPAGQTVTNYRWVGKVLETPRSTLYLKAAIRVSPDSGGNRESRVLRCANDTDGLVAAVSVDAVDGAIFRLWTWANTDAGVVRGQNATPYMFFPDRWYVLEMKVVMDQAANDIIVVVRMNGTTVLSETFSAVDPLVSQWEITRVEVAAEHIGSEGIRDIWFDDFELDDALWPGLGGVFALQPSADVQAQWNPSTGSANWDLVNDLPVDDSTYVYHDQAGVQDIYALTDLDPLVTKVTAVQQYVRARLAVAGQRQIKAGLRASGGTTISYTVDEQVFDVDPNWGDFVGNVLEQNPFTASPWTPADVNGLEYVLELGS